MKLQASGIRVCEVRRKISPHAAVPEQNSESQLGNARQSSGFLFVLVDVEVRVRLAVNVCGDVERLLRR